MMDDSVTSLERAGFDFGYRQKEVRAPSGIADLRRPSGQAQLGQNIRISLTEKVNKLLRG